MARFVLAVTLGNRGSDTEQDARMINAFIEGGGDPATGPRIRAVKRPGLDSAYTTTTGTGQGLFTWNTPGPLGPQQALVAISDDTLAYGDSITTLTKALRFVVPPATPQNIATSFTPDVTVEAISKAGKRVASFTSNVTVALADNPTGTTLGGTLTHAAVAGLATFNNLTSTRSGSDFSLAASASGLRGDISVPFSIPTHLDFTIQPPTIVAPDTEFSTVITARDTAGNVDPNFTGKVRISLFSGTPTSILSGTVEINAVAGFAVFADLSINIAASGYQLKAEFVPNFNEALIYSKPASAISVTFVVGGFGLTIDANTDAYDVYEEFVLEHGVPPSDVALSLAVNSGIQVNGITWNNSWTGTPTFLLNNNGLIYGKGGLGGTQGGNGSAGNNALELSGQTISIVNGSGFIWGGGGGGGGGGSIDFLNSCGSSNGVHGGAGGGGGGAPFGLGGSAGFMDPPGSICAGPSVPSFTRTQGIDGDAAGEILGGNGGSGGSINVDACVGGGCTDTPNGTGGNGGSGAIPGSAGSDGASATVSDGSVISAGTGGAAGKAINLSGGTANFISGSGSPNVLGAVS